MDNQLQSLDQIKASAIDMAMRFGPKLLVAIAILVVGYLVARWVGRMVDRHVAALSFRPPVRQLLDRVGRVLVFGPVR
jgi:small conductance mechanosensitive channel